MAEVPAEDRDSNRIVHMLTTTQGPRPVSGSRKWR